MRFFPAIAQGGTSTLKPGSLSPHANWQLPEYERVLEFVHYKVFGRVNVAMWLETAIDKKVYRDEYFTT